MAKHELEAALEQEIGKSIEEIRNLPVDEMREKIESSIGRPLNYKSYYPIIGRGNILRDRLVTHDRVEERLSREMNGTKKAPKL